AGDPHVDEVGLERFEGLVVKTEPLSDTWPIVLQEDIRGLYELVEQLLALLSFQVDGERALVAVQRQERDVNAVRGAPARGGLTLPLTARRLDLDHVGAEFPEVLRCQRACHRD